MIIEMVIAFFIGTWIGSAMAAIAIGIYETVFEDKDHLVPLKPTIKFSEQTLIEKMVFLPFFPIYYLIIYTLG